MSRVRYLRPASGKDQFATSAKPHKASLGRDGYEVLAERKTRDPFDYMDESKELTDTRYEPSLSGGRYDEDC